MFRQTIGTTAITFSEKLPCTSCLKSDLDWSDSTAPVMTGPDIDEKTDVLAVFNGYTEAEEGLRATEEQLRTISDNVPQLIWTNLPNGEANYFNKRWYEFTGLTYEQS
ncbi:MAG TPA: PAS domain-containing protein, partial [Candidatus Acidoferrum sp.]|nr:PAS domain-containing protein [Candidatus Acidoferrum sp.]